MSNRTIKIYTTLGSPGSIETNVRTKVDLMPLLVDRGIDTNGMKLLIGETRNELSEDTAILPEGDFKLYLVPSRTKSGSTAEEKLALLKDLLEIKSRLVALRDEAEAEQERRNSSKELPEELKKFLERLGAIVKVKVESPKEDLSADEIQAKKDIEDILYSNSGFNEEDKEVTSEWD